MWKRGVKTGNKSCPRRVTTLKLRLVTYVSIGIWRLDTRDTLHVYFENFGSYILRNEKLYFSKSKDINGKPRIFRIKWWCVSIPEATEEPLRPEIDITSTKALPQKGCNFKNYKSERNELTENPKTLLESS